MSHICMYAEECRAFIKNGKLRFQARKMNRDNMVEDQVTITLPQEMARLFTEVEHFDAGHERGRVLRNRINDLLGDG